MNPGSISKPRDGSGGSFGLLVTSEDSLWGKIYSYEDFMQSTANSQKPETSANAPKKKVKGGHLRDLLNYSDRF